MAQARHRSMTGSGALACLRAQPFDQARVDHTSRRIRHDNAEVPWHKVLHRS